MGSAEDIYNTPQSKFVADFIGSINFLPAKIVGEEGEWAVAETVGFTVKVPKSDASAASSGEVSIAVAAGAPGTCGQWWHRRD